MNQKNRVFSTMLLIALMSGNIGGVFIKEESKQCSNTSISTQENAFYKVLEKELMRRLVSKVMDELEHAGNSDESDDEIDSIIA